MSVEKSIKYILRPLNFWLQTYGVKYIQSLGLNTPPCKIEKGETSLQSNILAIRMEQKEEV